MGKSSITNQVIATLIVCRQLGTREAFRMVGNMEKPRVCRVACRLLSSFKIISDTSMASLNAGFHTGWISPTLVKMDTGDFDFPVTSDQGSWIASVFLFACAFGALIAGIIANRWGRKMSLLSTAVPYALSCILIIAAQNYWWLIFARFIAGLGWGGSATVLPMYLGEIAGDQIRGALGVLFSQMTSFGVLIAYCVGPWVSRVVFASVGLVLPVIFVTSFIWMPESPYFLVMKGRPDRAAKSLTWLRRTSDVSNDLKKVEENVANEQTGTFRELIMAEGNRKALFILTTLMLAPQLSGTNAITAYTSVIFEATGSELSTSISVIIIGVVDLASVALSLFTVDLVGRRPLLMLSFGGSIIFLIAEGLYFQLKEIGTDVSSISWLPMTAMVGYVVFYAIGLGCLPFVILSEILPCNVKAVAMMYAIFVIAVSGMTVTKLYQIIADAYGIHVSFYGFAACSILMAILVYVILPETKQMSFGEIQEILSGSKNSKVRINVKI